MLDKRKVGMVLAVLLSGCCGCVSTMDDALLEMRSQALANEKLYAAAELEFADNADKMAQLKTLLHHDLLTARDARWIEKHTVDGQVICQPGEMEAAFAARDKAYASMEETDRNWSMTVKNYRRMVADKQAFSAVIYQKEVNADEARKSLAAATDSVLKALGGVAGSMAVALPLLIP